jgi:hypothetical protein
LCTDRDPKGTLVSFLGDFFAADAVSANPMGAAMANAIRCNE